jgi:hypothetical protein
MRKLLFYIVLFAIKFSSCQQKESSFHPEVLNVPLGRSKLNASRLFERIDYLRLKGNGELYPSKVDQLEFIADDILIMDKSLGAIFKFSSNGELLGILHKIGQGPEEYEYLHKFLVDRTNHRIEVYDKVGQKIIAYDKNLNFIESFKVGLYFENFQKIGDKKYLIYTAQDNIFDSNQISNNLLVWNNGKIDFEDIPRKETDRKSQVRGLYPLDVTNEYIVTQSFNDTIYIYSEDKNSISSKINVKFEYPLKKEFSSIDELHEYSNENIFSSAIDYLLRSNDILSFNYVHYENGKKSTMSYYYFPAIKKHISSKSLYNDFDNFNLFKHSNLKGDTFINVIEPDYLSLIEIENTSSRFQNSIDLNLPLEDQMIILFLKLKDPSLLEFE